MLHLLYTHLEKVWVLERRVVGMDNSGRGGGGQTRDTSPGASTASGVWTLPGLPDASGCPRRDSSCGMWASSNR